MSQPTIGYLLLLAPPCETTWFFCPLPNMSKVQKRLKSCMIMCVCSQGGKWRKWLEFGTYYFLFWNWAVAQDVYTSSYISMKFTYGSGWVLRIFYQGLKRFPLLVCAKTLCNVWWLGCRCTSVEMLQLTSVWGEMSGAIWLAFMYSSCSRPVLSSVSAGVNTSFLWGSAAATNCVTCHRAVSPK